MPTYSPTDKDTLYLRLSKEDKDKLHTILFSAIHSNYPDLIKEIRQTGVDMNNIKDKVVDVEEICMQPICGLSSVPKCIFASLMCISPLMALYYRPLKP